MEKLELKHYLPYLDSGVRIWYEKDLDLADCCDNEFEKHTLQLCIHTVNSAIKEQAKMILNPLSDLTKEIEVDGKKLIPIVEICKIGDDWGVGDYDFKYKTKTISDRTLICVYTFQNDAVGLDLINGEIRFRLKNWHKNPYWMIERLHAWHFDVFGLIKCGCAIDINTLK